MSDFRHPVGSDVTVFYPPTPRYPTGRTRHGTVERRSVEKDRGYNRYAVQFTDGSADVMIPEYWIQPRGQLPLAEQVPA